MVERGSMKLYIFLLCFCINITFGSNIKGHTRQHLENVLLNSPQRNEEVPQGEQFVPRRGETAPERGHSAPERGHSAPERGHSAPEQGETAPERGHASPERGHAAAEQGESAPERGHATPGRDEAVPRPGEILPERGEVLPGQDETDPERGEPVPDEFLPGARGTASERPERKCSCDCTNILASPHKSYTLEKGFGYYKYHNHGKNWFAAKKQCEMEGAHLAIINSPKERDLLLKIYKGKPAHGKNPAIFIGVNDLVEDGTWLTIFDEPLNKTGFAEWNKYEPSGNANQNCGTLQVEAGKMHDHECGNDLGFICEREMEYIPHCY